MEDINLKSGEPLVSIVMPLYNYGRFLEASVDSVLAQKCKNWELIIVDDCSTDDSYQLALDIANRDDRIKVFRLDKNGGTSAARNKALDESRGEYVAFLDSDDLYDPDYLETQISLLKSGEYDIAVASYRRMASKSVTDFIVPSEITFKSILKGNPMAPLGTVYRFSKFRDLRFLTDMRKCEDYVFFLQLLQSGAKAIANKKVCATLTIHDDSKSKKKHKLIKWQYLSYKKVGINFFMRFYYLFRWGLYGIKKYRKVK